MDTDAGAAADESRQTANTDRKGRHHELREAEVERAVDHIIARGRPRLFRTAPELLASGIIAGVEIAFGIVAFLAVEQATGSSLVAGVAFSIGLITLLLGNSELFTEGFLVPIAVVVAKEATWLRLLRFWGVTLVGNLTGGWAAMWMAMTALPGLGAIAVDTGEKFANAPLSLQTFVLAVLAGSAMTLLTRMRIGTGDDMARVVACVVIGFLVAGLGMFHSILDTLFIFGGIHAGAEYGYGAWAVFFGWTALGNLVGGIGLTTTLRLVRSHERLAEWRATHRPRPAQRRGEQARD